MLKYEILVLGNLETNCYLIWNKDSKDCFIIDPADDGVEISEEIIQRNLLPKGILLTHGHFDHVLGALDLKLIFNIPLYCSRLDWFLLDRQDKTANYFLKRKIEIPNFNKIDVDLDKIEEIELGNEIIKVIKTPGHTPGSVCFYSNPPHKGDDRPLLFSGDTLFAGLRGRTDFSYGSTKNIFESLNELMKLPEDTIVLSGHGPATTIERESQKYLKK